MLKKVLLNILKEAPDEVNGSKWSQDATNSSYAIS